MRPAQAWCSRAGRQREDGPWSSFAISSSSPAVTVKVWHYFEHVRHSVGYVPLIAFSQRTRWDNGNPWSRLLSEGTKVFAAASRRHPVCRRRRLSSISRRGPGRGPRFPSSTFSSMSVTLTRGAALRVPCHTGRFGSASARGGGERGGRDRACERSPACHPERDGSGERSPNARPGADEAATWLIAGVKAPELGAALLRRLSTEGRRVRLPTHGSRARRSSQRLRTAGSRCCCRTRGRVLPACHRGDGAGHTGSVSRLRGEPVVQLARTELSSAGLHDGRPRRGHAGESIPAV